jgi:hypothetical protein
MSDEISTLLNNGTWVLVPPSPSRVVNGFTFSREKLMAPLTNTKLTLFPKVSKKKKKASSTPRHLIQL